MDGDGPSPAADVGGAVDVGQEHGETYPSGAGPWTAAAARRGSAPADVVVSQSDDYDDALDDDTALDDTAARPANSSGVATSSGAASARLAKGDGEPRSAGVAPEEVRRRVRETQTKLAGMQDGLIRSLDVAAYAQMSALYYMDNSLSLLLLRLLPHWLFYTPKPSFFPPPPTRRPYVLAAVLTTGMAVLAHSAADAPSAGEATRGYLHGGFLIDFVGELGPVSKLRLLAADLAVLVLQMVLLALVLERERLKGKMGGPTAAAAAGGAASAAAAAGLIWPPLNEMAGQSVGELLQGQARGEVPRQDHDAEEQGFLRRDGGDGGQEQQEEEEEDAEPGGEWSQEGKHHLDELYSGTYLVADLKVLDAVRRSWWWNYER